MSSEAHDSNDYGHFYPSSYSELLQYTSDEEIYYHYFGYFENDGWYKSPFRPTEKKPSFTISYYGNRWVWRDFGIDRRPQDSVRLVELLHDLHHTEALKMIYDDIVLKKESKLILYKTPKNSIKLPPSVKIWKVKSFEKEYWEQGKLTDKEIQHYNIYGCEIWNNNIRTLLSKVNQPVFCYLFDRAKKIWKGYNPYSTEFQIKFFSNNISEHVQNWENLGITGSDILFITKSYKDCIVLNKLDYDAIAPHSENMFLAPWDIDYLKTIYKHIYVFYDNDVTGVKKCKEFTEFNKLKYINVPLGLSTDIRIIKDPWDVITNYDYKLLDSIIIDKFIRDGV